MPWLGVSCDEKRAGGGQLGDFDQVGMRSGTGASFQWTLTSGLGGWLDGWAGCFVGWLVGCSVVLMVGWLVGGLRAATSQGDPHKSWERRLTEILPWGRDYCGWVVY